MRELGFADRLLQFTPGAGGKPAATSPTSQPAAAASTKPSSSSSTAAGATKPAANADGADDNDTNSTSSFEESDAPSPTVDGNNEQQEHRPSPALSPFISRSASPAPFTGGGMGGRAASPISFGYPYHNSTVRDGYLSESHTPTAIQG